MKIEIREISAEDILGHIADELQEMGAGPGYISRQWCGAFLEGEIVGIGEIFDGFALCGGFVVEKYRGTGISAKLIEHRIKRFDPKATWWVATKKPKFFLDRGWQINEESGEFTELVKCPLPSEPDKGFWSRITARIRKVWAPANNGIEPLRRDGHR